MAKGSWVKWLAAGLGSAVLVATGVAVAGTVVAQAASETRVATMSRGSYGFGLVDMQALLAEALGISVEELEAAQREAHEAAIQQLEDAGHLTEEQADLARAGVRLKAYFDREALVAEALGMSVDDLAAAIQEGKTLTDLLDEQGMDREEYRDNLAATRAAAIDRAVEDGVITQEQAEQLEDFHFPGFGPGHGPPGGGLFFRQIPEDAPAVDTLFG